MKFVDIFSINLGPLKSSTRFHKLCTNRARLTKIGRFRHLFCWLFGHFLSCCPFLIVLLKGKCCSGVFSPFMLGPYNMVVVNINYIKFSYPLNCSIFAISSSFLFVCVVCSFVVVFFMFLTYYCYCFLCL